MEEDKKIPSDSKEDKNIPKKETKIDLGKYDQLRNFIITTDDTNKIIQKIIDHVKTIITDYTIFSNYEIRFLFDPMNSIDDSTADKIYNSLSKNPIDNLLLVIHSPGGSIEPAYLISKCCKQIAKKFVVVVPRQAKSAATLISLGANEIHMGQMSQLGPIDPQIGGLPALGLGNAVEYLAGMSQKYPESSQMLAKYLSYKLDLRILGFFERVTESAVQYAERLLEGKTFPNDMNKKKVAEDLVYAYKDHGFVIDYEEAGKYLGSIIKKDTEEYKMGDKIHRFLEDVSLIMYVFKNKQLSFIGGIDGGLRFSDIKKE